MVIKSSSLKNLLVQLKTMFYPGLTMYFSFYIVSTWRISKISVVSLQNWYALVIYMIFLNYFMLFVQKDSRRPEQAYMYWALSSVIWNYYLDNLPFSFT